MTTTTVNTLGTTNPIQIQFGGTNAANAPDALTNLGALPIAGGTMTGSLILNANPVAELGAVTKQYADAISAGLTIKIPCYAGTTGSDLGASYSNGASGVGATLTYIINATFIVDGLIPPLNARILVKNQNAAITNGIYILTTVGSGGMPWVLTRATDYDTPAEIFPGTFILIQNGTVNANTAWIETSTVTSIGIGGSPITFSQFGNPGTVTSVSGIAGQIDVANGTSAAVVSIDSGYVGQTSITTLGTIGTGTWEGTPPSVPFGGTGNDTFTAYSLICAGTTNTGDFQNVVSLGSIGEVLISAGAGALPVWGTQTGTPWVDQTSSSVTMAVNTSYVADNAGLVTFTLPVTAAFGSTFQVVGKGGGGWKLAQNSSQQINFGNAATMSGTGGYLASTNQFDSVTLVCVTANTQFVVYGSIGNVTVN